MTLKKGSISKIDSNYFEKNYNVNDEDIIKVQKKQILLKIVENLGIPETSFFKFLDIKGDKNNKHKRTMEILFISYYDKGYFRSKNKKENLEVFENIMNTQIYYGKENNGKLGYSIFISIVLLYVFYKNWITVERTKGEHDIYYLKKLFDLNKNEKNKIINDKISEHVNKDYIKDIKILDLIYTFKDDIPKQFINYLYNYTIGKLEDYMNGINDIEIVIAIDVLCSYLLEANGKYDFISFNYDLVEKVKYLLEKDDNLKFSDNEILSIKHLYSISFNKFINTSTKKIYGKKGFGFNQYIYLYRKLLFGKSGIKNLDHYLKMKQTLIEDFGVDVEYLEIFSNKRLLTKTGIPMSLTFQKWIEKRREYGYLDGDEVEAEKFNKKYTDKEIKMIMEPMIKYIIKTGGMYKKWIVDKSILYIKQMNKEIIDSIFQLSEDLKRTYTGISFVMKSYSDLPLIDFTSIGGNEKYYKHISDIVLNRMKLSKEELTIVINHFLVIIGIIDDMLKISDYFRKEKGGYYCSVTGKKTSSTNKNYVKTLENIKTTIINEVKKIIKEKNIEINF